MHASTSRYSLFIFIFLLSMSLTATFAHSKEKREDREPEAATGVLNHTGLTTERFMVVAANPYASEAGFNILKQGGSAIDAAIAVQLVLTLVEPQSSGIGGGAFLVHWDKSNKALTTFDGRETAPKAVTENLFLDTHGKPISWREAIVGGRSVGVPGVLAALKKAHELHGKLPWQTLFSEAIALAENGFVVSPRLEKLLTMGFNPGLKSLTTINQYFYPNGKVIKAGEVLKNPKLAKVYKQLAKQGVKPFYHGKLAEKIVAAVQDSSIAPGALSLSDMKAYQAIERAPVCGLYKQFKVCGMGPPSSGGIAVIQILAQLESFNMGQLSPTSLAYTHLFTQSSRLAFADRAKYIADTDFVSVPVNGLLDATYLAKRASLININNDLGKAVAGMPHGALVQANDMAYEMPSTSHISIVDDEGNAVSMTTSIEMAFGSAVMVEGFILNNQLTDFSFKTEHEGKLIANRVQPRKRPRSSMAPMMVFNPDGSLKLVIGSPGGSRIINYVAQKTLALLDLNITPQQAVALPNVTNRNKITTLEKHTTIAELSPALEAKAHRVAIKDLNSGLHVIEINNGMLKSGVDPRREGKAMGL